MIIFILGMLLGVLGGGAVCVRYLRHEIAADIAHNCGACTASSITSRRH